MTGSTPPSLRLEDAESAANFTSGGARSKRTSSGKRSALASARPLSSLTPAGSFSVAAVASGSGAANVTSLIVARFSSSLEKVGAIAVPSAVSMRIALRQRSSRSARRSGHSAFSTGLHPAAALTRAHSNRAVNGLRTV